MTRRRRPPPEPPHPELRRRPRGGFGWLEAELLHDGWLADLGPEAVAVLALLAIAADSRGASYFSRDRMVAALGMARSDVDRALARLLERRVVDLRPWRPGCVDGVWQLLPLRPRDRQRRAGRALSAAELLRQLGFVAPETGDRQKTADPGSR